MYSLAKTKLPEAIKSIKIDEKPDTNSLMIKKYISSLNGIKLVTSKPEANGKLDYIVKIDSELQELNSIYVSILELDLAITFNPNVRTEETSTTGQYKLSFAMANA